MRVRPSVLLLGLLQSPSSSAFLQQGPSERRIHIVSPLADHSEEPSTQAHHTLDNRMLINVLESPSSLVANGSSSSSKNNNNNSNELQPRIRVPQPPAPRRPRLKNTDVALLRKQTTALLENVEPKRKLKKTFHYLMDAWAFSQQDDAVEQASKLLQIMETSHATLPEIRPDVRSYTKFINVVARSSAGSDLAGRRADQVLAKMKTRGVTDALLRPNTYTYQACLESHAHTGSPESARRARELCQEMVQYYKEGHEDIRPTARAWTAAITACGKAILATEPHHDKIYLATEAQAILDQLLELSNHDSQLEAPNSYNYNALITAWANAGETSRAEQVLEKMEARFEKGNMNAQPTTVSYNAVIDAYAKAGDAFKAEELLRHMEDLYEGGAQNLRPNVRSFNSVINAWAKSHDTDGATRAQEMLDLMEQLYKQGNEEVRPDVHSFCSVINAWARSQEPRKAERAYNLLREMIRQFEAGNKNVRPNVIAYNAVMNACAFTSNEVNEQGRAMEIAHTTLKQMEEAPYANPDQVTYGTFLRLCAHMPDCSTRQKVTEVLFRKCAKEGQVGSLVLSQLKTMVADDVYERLVGRRIDEDTQMTDLPKEWWCNVVEGKWRRKRSMK